MIKKVLFLIVIAFGIFSINFSYADSSGGYAKELKNKLDDAEKVAREEFNKLHDTVNSTKSPDERNVKGFVLSTEVLTFKDIPENVDKEISIIRDRIRQLIFHVATDIETTGSTGSVNISQGGSIDYDLPADARRRYENIMEAKVKNNVSVMAVKVSFELLSAVNKSLISEAKKENNVSVKRKAYITQAAFVYEMSDIVLDILDKIELEGKPSLKTLKAEQDTKLKARKAKLEKSLQKVESSFKAGKVGEKPFKSLEKSYGNLLKVTEAQLEGWEDLMGKVGKQDNWLNDIKNKKDLVEFKRDLAKHQLDTLRDMYVLENAMSIIGNMDELVEIIENIELLELDEKTVQKLLFGNVQQTIENSSKDKEKINIIQ